ncbi:uncharacterized protein LOC133439543, partial [Cololabis saira]|uniref:uncharacterized protein LOC133439543 n=1 Tax=Cololabis saira TaxID=129043 RepID=UPI002AD21B19
MTAGRGVSPSDFRPGHGTGHRHRVLKWDKSTFTPHFRKLVVPEESPDKKFVLLVGDSHLRPIADGLVGLPDRRLSCGVLSVPGASALELRTEVLNAVLPRSPAAVCILAPSNDLSASGTVTQAGVAFGKLLLTACSTWPNVCVLDFPRRLTVDLDLQELLSQEYHRVAARMGVRYVSATHYFPLTQLDLWCPDGVHLSKEGGMERLAELLWWTLHHQLEPTVPRVQTPPRTSPPARRVVPRTQTSPRTSPPARRVVPRTQTSPRTSPPARRVVPRTQNSPRTSPPARRVSPKRVVKDVVTAPRPSSPLEQTYVLSSQVDVGMDSIPLNPVWFSPAILDVMEKAVPAHLPSAVESAARPDGRKQKSTVERRDRGPSKRTREKQQVEAPAVEVSSKPAPCSPRRVVVEPGASDPAQPQESTFQERPSQDPAVGPSHRTQSVRASHSQKDGRYGTFSRNHQCTCMALTFLAYHQEGVDFDMVSLDRVLEQGNALYVGIKEQLKADKRFKSNHLTIEEMPKQVFTDSDTYNVQLDMSDLRVGFLKAVDGSPRSRRGLCLREQLKSLSQGVNLAFLIVAPECIAVFRDR